MKANEQTFSFVGNNLAIDFVNTQVVEKGEIVELLHAPEDLISWMKQAGFSPDANIKQQSIRAVIDFRIVLREIFSAVIDGSKASKKVLDQFNKYLSDYSIERKLTTSKNGLTLSQVSDKYSFKKLAGEIANEAAELLSSDQVHKLKRCSNPKCILMFLDTSKSGRRRWCSMDVCGNRAKAASYYQNSKQ